MRMGVCMTVRGPADPSRLAFLAGWSYAHRGLHSPGGPPENSLPAFAAALDAGHGMECDVRLSVDGIAHVFHDAMLDRMTGQPGALATLDAARLAAIELKDGGGPIPPLSALLDLVAGRAPLLIELKVDRLRDTRPLCEAVRRDLAGYEGPVAVMSFSPRVSRWFHFHAPHIVHGLVMTEEGRKGVRGRIARHLAIAHAHPDFLAYDIRDLPSHLARTLRERGYRVLSWTVRDERQWRLVEAEADAAIFEGPPPASVTKGPDR